MELAPLPAVSLDALRALASNDGLRDGTLLRAKVEAMLSSTLARLDIEGQKVDLATTRPLAVGTMLTLKVQHQDGQLQLVAQEAVKEGPVGETANATPPDHRGRGLIGNLTDPTRTPLEKFQAATVGAMLEEADDPNAPWTQIAHPEAEAEAPQQEPSAPAAQQNPKAQAGAAAQLAADDADAHQHFQTPAETLDAARIRAGLQVPAGQTGPDIRRTQTAVSVRTTADAKQPQQVPPEAGVLHGIKTAAQAAAHIAIDDPAPEGRQRVATADDLVPAQSHAASEAALAQQRTTQTTAFAVDVPLFFPGNPVPLRLEVTRDDEPAAQDGEEPRPRAWTVRFAAEAGPLGMVHAAISLIDGHIGVQLLAEDGDTAEQFKQNAAQLRTALQASDLQVDAVSIGQGGPARQELDVQ